MPTTTTDSPRRTTSQLADLGNQMYLSFVDSALRSGERSIKLAQYFLSEADAVQRELRQAVEQATEEFRGVEQTTRAMTTNFFEASAQIFEANRNIALTFNNVIADAQERNASFLQTAVSETRAAQQDSRKKTAEAVNRSVEVGAAVLGQAEKAGNGASSRKAAGA